MNLQAGDIESGGFIFINGYVKEKTANEGYRGSKLRARKMQKCSSFNGLTSTISEAPVITHRAEVFKDKDSHSWDNEQHHKHHNPDVSAEGLWGRKKKSVLRVKTENKEILINLPIYSLMQHAFLRGKQTRGVYIPSDNQGLDWGGIRGYASASPFIWWASQGLFSFKHIKRTASLLRL